LMFSPHGCSSGRQASTSACQKNGPTRMFNITMKISREPVELGDVVGEVERAAIDGIRDDLKRKLEQAMSPEELDHLSVELSGDSISTLVVNLAGPTEIIVKARQVIEAK
jgi:hypothetical protein